MASHCITSMIAAARAQNVGLISGACRSRCADWRLLRTTRDPPATSRRDVCAHREDPCTGRPTRESDCSDWQPTSALSAVDAALFDAAQQGGVSQPQPQPTPTCMRRSSASIIATIIIVCHHENHGNHKNHHRLQDPLLHVSYTDDRFNPGHL